MGNQKYLDELEFLLDLKQSNKLRDQTLIQESNSQDTCLSQKHLLSSTSTISESYEGNAEAQAIARFNHNSSNSYINSANLNKNCYSNMSCFYKSEHHLLRNVPINRGHITLEELFMEIESIEKEAQKQRMHEKMLKKSKHQL